jgi:hypothetical protein
MKFPKGYFDNQRIDNIIKRWVETADQLSMEYGVLVEVKIEIEENGNNRILGKYEVLHVGDIVRIFFNIADKEFESAIKAKIALKNKAFL